MPLLEKHHWVSGQCTACKQKNIPRVCSQLKNTAAQKSLIAKEKVSLEKAKKREATTLAAKSASTRSSLVVSATVSTTSSVASENSQSLNSALYNSSSGTGINVFLQPAAKTSNTSFSPRLSFAQPIKENTVKKKPTTSKKSSSSTSSSSASAALTATLPPVLYNETDFFGKSALPEK